MTSIHLPSWRAMFELTEADLAVMKACLYRPSHLDSSKTSPMCIVDACEYLQRQYCLTPKEAKEIVDAIKEQSHSLFFIKSLVKSMLLQRMELIVESSCLIRYLYEPDDSYLT
jgi:hypothetical protein